jgi:transcriptional regulator with XRE-family HTH domain
VAARRAVYGNRIKELRERLGLRVRDLAQAVGVNDAQISKLERGLTNLSQAWLYRLAKPLQCQPWEILPEWQSGFTANYDDLVEQTYVDEAVQGGERRKLVEIEISLKLIKLASNDEAAIIATVYCRPDRYTRKKRSDPEDYKPC